MITSTYNITDLDINPSVNEITVFYNKKFTDDKDSATKTFDPLKLTSTAYESFYNILVTKDNQKIKLGDLITSLVIDVIKQANPDFSIE